MEIEYFVEPNSDEPHFEQWKKDSWNWWVNKI
jgi:glycyl-tRNA synthetase (class II)